MIGLFALILPLWIASFGSHGFVKAGPLEEKLVISALIDHPSFSVVELVACSTIANLNAYSLEQYASSFSVIPYKKYTGSSSYTNIAPETKIYVLHGRTIPAFETFFGLDPSVTVDLTIDLSIYGERDFKLVDGDGKEHDVYLGEATGAAFSRGWAQRKPGTAGSTSFNKDDWIINPGAYDSAPTSNLDATPPITFGTYTCSPEATTATMVISALVDYPDFSVVELTACGGTISSLDAFSFEQFERSLSFSPYQVYTGNAAYTNIPFGTFIYLIHNLTPLTFRAFFDVSSDSVIIDETNDL